MGTGAPTVARARICAHECKQGTPKRRHNGTLEHRGIGTRMIPRGGLRTFFFDVFGATKRGFCTCRGVTPVHPFRHFPAHYHKKKKIVLVRWKMANSWCAAYLCANIRTGSPVSAFSHALPQKQKSFGFDSW